VGLLAILNTVNFSRKNAYAESDGIIYDEGIENENLAKNEKNKECENIMLSGGSARSDNALLISGTNNFVDPFQTCSFADLTSVKYISNANYFLINPQQGINDGSGNSGGTCTTVAMQILVS
jgi:hypothetical protein